MDEKQELMVQSGLVAWANGVSITNQSDADSAMARLSEIKGWRKRWTDYWKELKENASKAHKDICAKERQGTDPVDQAEMRVKGKLIEWQRQEQEKAQAEQRRLQAIADEQARKERERLEAQAAKLKTPEKAQERIEQAAAIVAPVISVAAPKMSGTVTTWKAELVDMAALVMAAKSGSIESTFLVFDQSAANKFAANTKGSINVAGIKWVKQESLAIRSR